MPTFLLTHHHTALECAQMFAAWRGFTSPLRHRDALSSCPQGGHRLWWVVEAPDEAAALGQLPAYVSRQTEVTNVRGRLAEVALADRACRAGTASATGPRGR